MGQINHVPSSVPQAGLDFDYSVWTPGTIVQLSNVPWDAMYRDVVYWPGTDYRDTTSLDAYLTANSGSDFTLSNVTYCKPGHPIRLPISFNRAWQWNYMRVTNPVSPAIKDQPRSYYYFVNDVRYVNPSTTEFDVQLDVWTTFIKTVDIVKAYVERGHIGIAWENSFEDYGQRILTVPEGFDLGTDYVTRFTEAAMIAAPKTLTRMGISDEFEIIITSTIALQSNPGTVDNPSMYTAIGSGAEGLPNGCEIYVLTIDQFEKLAGALTRYPWVGQGILSITAVPKLPRKNARDTYFLGDTTLAGQVIDDVRFPHQERTVLANFRSKIENDLPYRFEGLKKFQTYPYTAIELTTYTGTPIILKPELIKAKDVNVVQMSHIVPPSPRIMFYPLRYAAGKDGTIMRITTAEYGAPEVWSDHGAEFLDMMLGIFNLPQFSITNSGYLNYMASNAHSIAYGYQSADWSQQRALAGNQLGFDQATAAMELQNTMTGIQTQQMGQTTALGMSSAAMRGVASIGTRAAGGVLSGGIAGAALGAAGTVADTAISMNQMSAQNSIDTSAVMARNSASVGTAGYMRDTNKKFADWAARGDYANTIAGLNAKVQDAKLIQPTTAGQSGGDAFLLSTIGWGVHAKVKQIPRGAMEAIGEYWLRFGYAINRWVYFPEKPMAMQKMTYWKCKETYLRSSFCPEYYKGVIRGIFEKGVTVWANPDDIGVLDPTLEANPPIEGLSL